ncbi:MAG: hypothetical protein ACKOBD_14750 [Chloroflexota bacterium]
MFPKSYVDPRERENIRAHEGQDMWVILNHVRADKKETFEHFLHAILMPAVAHVEPEVYNKVRVLHPTMPNKDGSYTYVFLMDPLVLEGEYNVENILFEFYKPDLAREYMKIWSEALIEQVEYDLIQSAW